MKSWRVLAALPAGLALALLSPTPASALGTPAGDLDTARANVISLDSVSLADATDGDGNPIKQATVSFTYTCVGTPVGWLWTSLKQPTDPSNTGWDITTEGTSGQSKAWDSMHSVVPCSPGSNAVPLHHTVTVVDEYGWFSDVELSSGPTFVQLCLTMPAGQNYKALGEGDLPKSKADKSFKLALNYAWVTL